MPLQAEFFWCRIRKTECLSHFFFGCPVKGLEKPNARICRLEEFIERRIGETELTKGERWWIVENINKIEDS